MANITVDVDAVLSSGTGRRFEDGVAGEDLDPGQPVYKSTSDGFYRRARAGLTEGVANARGITLHPSYDGQPIRILKAGNLTLGTGLLTKGKNYCVSATTGLICLREDLVSTNWITELGTALDADTLEVDIEVHGLQVP